MKRRTRNWKKRRRPQSSSDATGLMQPPSKIRLGLAAKLAICVVASTAVFFASFGYINLRMERTH